MKKRGLCILLACLMIAAILPIGSVRAASLPAAPNLNISYQQAGVSAGTIRYVSQLRASGNFCLSYWEPFEDAAGYECYTADISMALSGLGLDATPAALGTYWNQRGHTGGTPFTTVAWDVGVFGANYLERPLEMAMQAFLSDPMTYSAPIIHLTTYSERGHYVLVAGRIDATTFLIVDPANDTPWKATIENNNVEYLRNGEMRTEELEPAVQFKRVGSVSFRMPAPAEKPEQTAEPTAVPEPTATPAPTPAPKPETHSDGTSCPSHAFVDVPGEGDWSHAGIDYCIRNGLMQGTDASHFSPKTEMTRAMLVTVLYRAAGAPDMSGYPCPFTDLGQDWYRSAVTWAYHMGITSGVSADRFAPGSLVTREQLVAMLYRYRQLTTATPARIDSLDAFTDAGSISGWAQEPMRWAVTNGVLTGMTASELRPGGTANRAQLATILMRLQSL